MRKIFPIIQARMTSTRLPGKVMIPIAGISALELMLKRLNLIKREKQIIIATTDDGSESPITELCEKLGIDYFCGDTENVLERYYKAAESFLLKNEDIIIRMTSDCPLICSDIVEKTVEYYENNDFDYVSNIFERTFPRGLDTEVFSFKVLKTAFQNAKTKFEKEHVTTYINNTHKDEFSIGSLKDDADFSGFRLTLDTKEDLEAIKEVYRLAEDKHLFDYSFLKKILLENPEIKDINKSIEQKKV